MTTRAQLLEIITNGESSGVEFKRDVIVNHQLARELVAFSNLTGHHLVLRDNTRRRARRGCGHRARHTRLRCAQSVAQQSPHLFHPRRNPEPGTDPRRARTSVPAAWYVSGRTPASLRFYPCWPGPPTASGLFWPRKIIQGMRAHHGTTPALIEEGERFIVQLTA